MFASIAGIEILIRVAGEIAESFDFILHGVRVHNVHYHSHSISVGFVDESFEFFRGSESRTGRKKRAYVIAEAAVVRMFLDSHNLDGVISVGYDSGQDFFAELGVCSNSFEILSHSDMAFVD